MSDIVKFDDTWQSGAPINQIVLGGFIVKYTLPDGSRITSTLSDYNKHFRAIYHNEEKWREAANRKKRMSMGLNEDDRMKDAEWDAYFKSEIERLNQRA
jgi:hypothetical protein